MRQLGRDIAGVEIDHQRLHLKHMLGAGLALLGNGAGDHIDGAALPGRPAGLGGEQVRGLRVGGDPDVVRTGVDSLALVHEAADEISPRQ